MILSLCHFCLCIFLTFAKDLHRCLHSQVAGRQDEGLMGLEEMKHIVVHHPGQRPGGPLETRTWRGVSDWRKR